MGGHQSKEKKTEYMRRWRAAHPERARELARQSMQRQRKGHPEEARAYAKKWRSEHPESVKATQAKQIQRRKQARAANPEKARAYDRAMREKWNGIPETELHERFLIDHSQAVSLDRTRPDFYIRGDGFFEIKRALPFQAYNWRLTSQYFPGLHFLYLGSKGQRGDGERRHIDKQIALMPRPLIVIVYHALTGKEIIRKTFS